MSFHPKAVNNDQLDMHIAYLEQRAAHPDGKDEDLGALALMLELRVRRRESLQMQDDLVAAMSGNPSDWYRDVGTILAKLKLIDSSVLHAISYPEGPFRAGDLTWSVTGNFLDPSFVAITGTNTYRISEVPENGRRWRLTHSESLKIGDFESREKATEVSGLLAKHAALKFDVADNNFQRRVRTWMLTCFNEEIAADRLERGDRFLEEALELLQSMGYPQERVESLSAYVWARPAGEIFQEVGGTMVTLAALCGAYNVNMHDAGEVELSRDWVIIDKIRAKHASKPTGSALPGTIDDGK